MRHIRQIESKLEELAAKERRVGLTKEEKSVRKVLLKQKKGLEMLLDAKARKRELDNRIKKKYNGLMIKLGNKIFPKSDIQVIEKIANELPNLTREESMKITEYLLEILRRDNQTSEAKNRGHMWA